jgi:mannose-6-phosphate isomerase-like protein (cupin superfamily)
MSAATDPITPEEMKSYVVRFRDMTPRPKRGADSLPKQVLDFITPDANYTYLAPATGSQSIIQRYAALRGGDAGDAISVSLAVASPGRGPLLHAHQNTVEAFFCLSSRFSITWGDRGQHSLELDPWDLIAVPKGVARTFLNIGEEEGALLVIIQGNRSDFNDIVYPRFAADQLNQKFGKDTLEAWQATLGR